MSQISFVKKISAKVRKNFVISKKITIFAPQNGALAQLARVLDWQSRGHRFDSDMLHLEKQAFQKINWKACFLSYKKITKKSGLANC